MDIESLKEEWKDNVEIYQVYKEWGGTRVLKDLFNALDAYCDQWNKESELGSWAAEFIMGIMEENYDDLEQMDDVARKTHLNELLDERYDDCCESHQFARLANLQSSNPDVEDCSDLLEAGGDKIGFPII